jgi:LysR family transcriptional regulator, transcriptional activator for dmlA
MKIRDLSAWETFFWVAKDGSFTKAAKRLGIGLPLVSKRVTALEEELGLRLLQRSTRKVGLTQEGKSLFPEVQALLEDANSLEERFLGAGELSGTIRMACLTAFAHRVLPGLIAKFSRQHPKVKFELEISDTLIDLIENQIDLAIRVQEPSGADFVFRKLLLNRLVVCASPGYLKEANAPIRSPRDLLSHRLLVAKVYSDCRFQNSGLKVVDLLGARSIYCESGLFLTELALRGQGIAIRSLWDVGALVESGRLKVLLEKHPLDPFGSVYAVIPSRRLVSPRVRAFVDFLHQELAKA